MTGAARSAAGVLSALVALAWWLGGVGGCASDASEGYVFGGGFSSDVETVAVPIFRNETFERGIETAVTDAVLRELDARTPWRTVGRDVADTELRGTVTGYGLRQLASDEDTGLGSQMAVVVTVSFEWTDRRTGEVLVSRRNFAGTDFFVPALEAREPVEAGRAGAVSRVARGIVAELRSSW
jgi:hypothetical protein